MDAAPTFREVLEAAARIAPYVHRTPVVSSATLDRELGASVFFKCENLQKVGAFKARGATNAVMALGDEACARGVITHSSGNHGAALAFAAGQRGIRCTVVMQEGASPLKAAAIRGYGAEIVTCPVGGREQTTERLRAESGATLVHPFEHPHVIAGQGTAALELLEDVPDLDLVIAPIGGGGIMAGTCLSVAARRPEATLVGVEPLAADDAFRSLRDGIRYPGVPAPATRADGLLTGIGALPFAILQQHGVEVVCVGEPEMLEACRFHLLRMKLLVEPSSGVVLAALRTLGDRIRGRRVGAILTGGNTDLSWWSAAG
ncbi:MAG: threonine/serine dehydratase [Planctomycetes bacterium]|nr:threonine/serine dehydratase [Planctomycetota bacterium]MCB9872211.1 threonine/serine dehydratase [Planctomycetota bacterium]